MKPSVVGRTRRWWRLGTRLAWALGGVGLLCVVASNVLLRTRILRDAISSTSGSRLLRMEYASAYSVIPGVVVLEKFTLRGRDPEIEWFLNIDHCKVTIVLWDLFGKRFHASHVRADGVDFRMRKRLDRGNVTPERIAVQPSIPGFADPPYKDPEPAAPTVEDDHKGNWTVWLEDADVLHAREVWLDAVRTAGELRVRGRWWFQPQRWLDLGPVTVDVKAAEVTYGKAAMAVGLEGTVHVTIEPHNQELLQGAEIFRPVSMEVVLRGLSPTPSGVEALLGRPGAHVARAGGPVVCYAFLDHGRVRPGTVLSAQEAALDLTLAGGHGSGSLGAEVRVDTTGDGGVATRLDLRGHGVVVEVPQAPPVEVASVEVSLRAGEVDLVHADRVDFSGSTALLADVSVRGPSLDVRAPTIVFRLPLANNAHGTVEARVDVAIRAFDAGDTRALGRRMAVRLGLSDVEGAATGSANASFVFPARTMSGEASLRMPHATARAGSVTLASGIDATVALERGAWETGEWKLAFSKVRLHDLSASAGAAQIAVIGSIELQTSKLLIDRTEAKGTLSATLVHAAIPRVAHLASFLTLPKEIGLAGGTVLASGATDVDVPGWTGQGRARVDGLRLAVRLGARTVTGDVALVILAARPLSAGTGLDLSGTTLDVRNLTTSHTDRANDGWWAHLSIPRATLTLRPSLSFDAFVAGRARDAQPVDAVLSANTALPGWVASVFSMPNLRLSGVIRATPSGFGVQSFVAKGGAATIRLECRTAGATAQTAVLVEFGDLRAGVEVAAGKTSVEILDTQAWFEQRARAIGGARSGSIAPTAPRQGPEPVE